MKRTIKTVLAGFACSLMLAGGLALAELPQVSDARLIQPPPGAKVAAVYFTLTNTSSDSLIVSGVETEAAEVSELHLSKVEDDVALMIKQDKVTVNAGESLMFKHGSYHVMLMKLKETFVSGDKFDLTLQTSAGEISVSVPVISPDDAASMAHGSKTQKKHDM